MASMHWRYLGYVLRHKFYVYRAGRKLGVGRLQLLIHDWHKFLPGEWLPYARYFYGGSYPSQDFSNRNPQFGSILTKERVQNEFDLAWLKHQRRAKHHWQWWVLREDDGATKLLPMPDKYRREMLADWRGAGMALGKPDTKGWYEATCKGRMLHPRTKAWVEERL